MTQHTNTPIPVERPSFLQLVAEDLMKRTQGDLRQITLVFPTKRASSFLSHHLFQIAGQKPLWGPRHTTISELFEQISPLSVNDPIDTVCRLFRHYKETTQDPKTELDSFFGWGERLLADFDDIDKSMPLSPEDDSDKQVQQLFANISDLRHLDSLDYLTDEQKQVLQDFFRDFSLADTSEVRQRFLILWEQMYNIYHRLNEELRAEGLAYEGALMRSVVREERFRNTTGIYVFVGLSALSRVERELLRQFQSEGRAWFYWDYDVYYTETMHEAGLFMRDNLKNFPNSLSASCFDNLRHIEQMEFVSAPTENAQARSIAPWINGHSLSLDSRTAIVLAGEELLLPVLHSLPSDISEVNVTKGFPLGHTEAFTAVERFFAQGGENLTVISALTQLRTLAAESLQASVDENDTSRTLAWHNTYIVIGRFVNLAEGGRLSEISGRTLHKLLRYELRQTTVAFEGEPIRGIQVLGLLETRCLDFDNVLILSANEKILPRAGSDNSFIPYTLRRAFGLTLASHRASVYAYNFYRLIQRARYVRCVYNSSTEGTNTGERSRFMTQLMVESGIKINHISLTSMPNPKICAPTPISKPDNIEELLHTLTPSALNTYLDCPVCFYYQQIRHLRKMDDPADVIAENTFGSIFHKAAELIYRDLSRGLTFPVTASAIEALINDHPTLWRFIHEAFEQMDQPVDFNGVVAEVIEQYLLRMLRYDATLAAEGPIVIHGLEENSYKELNITTPEGKQLKVKTGGNIDRLDEITYEGRRIMRVVDYKTGGNPHNLSSKNYGSLFASGENRPRYIFQTAIYCHTLLPSVLPVAPVLYYVNHPLTDAFISYTDEDLKVEGPLTDYSVMDENFMRCLHQLVSEIMDTSKPFKPCTDHCSKCPFYLLCHAE